MLSQRIRDFEKQSGIRLADRENTFNIRPAGQQICEIVDKSLPVVSRIGMGPKVMYVARISARWLATVMGKGDAHARAIK